jgi:cell division protein FtsL
MSKFFSLGKRSKSKTRRKKKMISLNKINIKLTNVTLGVLIAVVGFSYLIQINGLATKGYQIRELEDQIIELQESNDDLELEALGLQSMGNVKDKIEGLNMVAIAETDYLVISPVAIAR